MHERTLSNERRIDLSAYVVLRGQISNGFQGTGNVNVDHRVFQYVERNMRNQKTFRNMIVVTGHPSKCVAMSCADYAEWYWEAWGTLFLEAMDEIFLQRPADDVF